MSESLSVYWGLFMNSGVPLEMALNYCGNCHYCFADLNSPERSANVPQIMNLITGFREKDTYAAKLLQMGYPVVLSNHVDPFSKSNAPIALPIIEVMAAQGIPILFQTKACKPAYTALDLVPQSCWYITITTLDNDVLRRVEPGAPSAEERLSFIQTAIAKGHRVTVGINPCVDEWVGDDPGPLVKAIQDAGAEGVWVQPLHLSTNQLKNMADIGKAAIGESVLNKARRFRKDPDNIDIHQRTCAAARAIGLEVYDVGQPQYSKFFQPMKDVYEHLFPTAQDFINYCYEQGKGPNDPIYWSEYRDFFTPLLPEGVLPLRNHLGASQYAHFWKDWENKIPKYMTYEDLLLWCWRVKQIVYSPVNVQCFVWAANIELDKNGERLIDPYMDADDLPIMLFRPEGSNYVYGQWSAW